MEGKYLVINAGSSSLKFSLYSMPDTKEMVSGNIEKIGNDDSFYTLKFYGQKLKKEMVIKDHAEAINVMIKELLSNGFINSIDEIKGIGHRVLHGAELYSQSVVIDENVLNEIKKLTKLGPLHHPGEVAGIESMIKLLPGILQVAVFDTAFHQTMPKENYLYAVPYSWYKENDVRKYGFHGTSHKYITEYMQKHLKRDDLNLIICHIGSGASISCVKDGVCYDTTMGLTPLDGLVMGTRSGAIDASIVEYICKERNMSIEQVMKALNKESGLFGIAGQNDLRDLEKLASMSDEKAILAITMFKNSIVKYIAQYYFALDGKIDALVFTAGVGENSADMRKQIVEAISNPMNVKLDEKMNECIAGFKEIQAGTISTLDSNFEIMVIPTDEEYMILNDTFKLAKKSKTNGFQKILK